MVEVVGCINETLWYHGSLKGKIAAKPMSLLNKYYIKKAPYALYVTQSFLQKSILVKGSLAGVRMYH